MIDQPVALVTGGSRGIGRAICLALAAEKFAVMINYNENHDGANDVRRLIEKKHGRADVVHGDITAPSHRDLMVEHTMETFGRIDLLVNNAGIAHPAPGDILESRDRSYNRVMNANLKGPYFLTCRVASVMIGLIESKAIKRADIINISSIRSFIVGEQNAEYCLAKAGIGMMTRLFATRLARHNIGVYEIAPGVIDTDMIRPTRARYAKAVSEGAAIQKRIGKPDEVARAVASIARGDFPYSTGSVFMVDGGLHIQRF